MKNSKGNLVALFDLDGTLVETDAVNSAAYRRVLAREGIKNVDRLAGRISMRSILTSLGGISKADALSLSRAKSEEYVRLLWNSDLGPAAEALRMVLASREQFSKVVLLTDGQEQRALETLRYHGLDQCFDEIVCNAGDGESTLTISEVMTPIRRSRLSGRMTTRKFNRQSRRVSKQTTSRK